MIHQLILNTLLACQPKTETETPEPVSEEQPTTSIEPSTEPPENIKTTPPKEEVQEDSPKKTPLTLVKELSKPKGSDEVSKFYSGSAKLSAVPYPRDNFTDEQFCNYICSNTHASGPKRLTNIENCQVELLENWEELRKDFSWDKVEENGNPVVGTVECNADLSYIRKGRAGLSNSKGSEVSDDLGGYFARSAQEEMTAVFAFQEMLQNLKSFNAPQKLLDDCERAICDEKRHTIMMSNMAKRHGCESAVVKLPKQQKVSILELAKHNAIAGCIEETWSALIAEHQSKHTKQYAKLFGIIAKDEIFHAQLSWDIHQWLMTKLSEKEQQEINALMVEHLNNPPESTSNFEALGEIPLCKEKQIWKEFCFQIEAQLSQLVA